MDVTERIAHLIISAAALAEEHGLTISIENEHTTQFGVVLDRTDAIITIGEVDE